MNSTFRGLGIVVIIVVLFFARNPKMFTNLVRGWVGPETPTADQSKWREMSDRLNRSTQYNPPIVNSETPAWIKKELNR
ncbi:MAG: hypothetical protein QM703_13890 [Gemmatales bacterium]